MGVHAWQELRFCVSKLLRTWRRVLPSVVWHPAHHAASAVCMHCWCGMSVGTLLSMHVMLCYRNYYIPIAFSSYCRL